MKDIPQKIYLQIGEDCPDDVSFKELTGVTWSVDKVFSNDIEFVLQQTACSTLRELLVQKLNRVKELQFGMDTITAVKHEATESTLQYVIEMIDELQPVA